MTAATWTTAVTPPTGARTRRAGNGVTGGRRANVVVRGGPEPGRSVGEDVRQGRIDDRIQELVPGLQGFARNHPLKIQ